MLTIKVVQLPGAINEVAVNPGTTVAEALRIAEIGSTSGKVIKVDGSDATAATVLTRNSTITVTSKITGNR